jgi:hypothetical protein
MQYLKELLTGFVATKMLKQPVDLIDKGIESIVGDFPIYSQDRRF